MDKLQVHTNLIGRKATGPQLGDHHELHKYNDQLGEIVAFWIEDSSPQVTLLYENGATVTWGLKYCTVTP